MKALVQRIGKLLARATGFGAPHKWARRTLVVGPRAPVDGDSLSCTVAVINHLRKMGLEAYTLPTLAMYHQIAWVHSRELIHPASHHLMAADLTTTDLQAAYDAVSASWQFDEVLLLDGAESELGFDTRGVKLFRIDHHVGKGVRDDATGYVTKAPSVGCILIERYGIKDPILAVSILTDTFWFRHSSPAQALKYMGILVDHGLSDELLEQYQRNLLVRKDPRILRIIRSAEMRLGADDEAVFMVLGDTDPELHRGVMGELSYFFRHICVARADGYVSFKTTDPNVDLRVVATIFGGGGHANQAAAQNVDLNDDMLLDHMFAEFVAAVTKSAQSRSAKR